MKNRLKLTGILLMITAFFTVTGAFTSPAEVSEDVSCIIYVYDGSSPASGGSIPESFGNLSYLSYLDLSDNYLSGDIQVICNLSNIFSLDLGNNGLSGSIPANMGNLSKLKYLYLNNNKLSGNIPQSVLNKFSKEKINENICPQQSGYGFNNCP